MFKDVLTALKLKIAGIVPNSKELSFPYDLETLNQSDNLSVGWGLVLGASTIENYYYHRRSVGLVLTRLYKRGSLQVKESELIDEAHELAYKLKQSLIGCGKITDLVILGDDGISFFEDNKYITTTLNLELLYQEL
jgi:hypothetical protein